LAHVGPVGAAAGQPDFLGRRKQAVAFPADPIHDALGEATLQQLDQRIDAPGAILANRLPALRRNRSDVDCYGVELGPADERRDLALGDLQVDDGAIADVGSPPRQAVCKVAVALEVSAPGLAPEGLGNSPTLDSHRVDRLSPLLELGELLFGLPTPLCDWHVGSPFVVTHQST